MLNSLISKAVQISIITLMTSTCLTSNLSTQIEYKEPAEIIETVSLPRTHQQIIDDLKEEVRYTANWNDRGTDTTIQLTQEDATWLMMVASAEALNQGETGMLHVMTVVINRVESPDFPNSVQEVIFQKLNGVYQFSTVANGSIFNADITPECHTALAKLESNKNLDKNIYAFESGERQILTKWFDVAYTYQDHTFYTLKKH